MHWQERPLQKLSVYQAVVVSFEHWRQVGARQILSIPVKMVHNVILPFVRGHSVWSEQPFAISAPTNFVEGEPDKAMILAMFV